VAGGIFYNLLNPSGGPVNELLLRWGVIDQSIDFISQSRYFRPLVIFSYIWKDIGWSSIIYLGVIASIDPTLYEAVEIDGGKRWAKIRYVTWPFLTPTFSIMFIMACGRIMSGAGDTFDQAYVFGNLANREVSDVLDTFILRVGLENARYSYASAANLFKSVINLLLLLTANRVSEKMSGNSLY
jgi:putative aldouronate transport system permease protein